MKSGFRALYKLACQRVRTRAGAAKRVNLTEFRRQPGLPGSGRFVLPAPGLSEARGSPGRGTNGDHKDIMSLAGLLNILDDDPQLRDVLARAGAGTDPVDTDLVAPPALRPVLAAALAHGDQPGGQGQRAGFVLAVTATAREAEDLTAGLGSF